MAEQKRKSPMPQTKAALERRGKQAKKTGRKVLSAADKRIAKTIDDPTGVKRTASFVKKNYKTPAQATKGKTKAAPSRLKTEAEKKSDRNKAQIKRAVATSAGRKAGASALRGKKNTSSVSQAAGKRYEQIPKTKGRQNTLKYEEFKLPSGKKNTYDIVDVAKPVSKTRRGKSNR